MLPTKFQVHWPFGSGEEVKMNLVNQQCFFDTLCIKHKIFFYKKSKFQSAGMNLKIKSRSAKSNKTSLLKFQPLVQDIVCTQAFFYQNLCFKVPV